MADISAKTERIDALEVQLASFQSDLDKKISAMAETTAQLEELQKAASGNHETGANLADEVKRLQELSDSLVAENEKKVADAQANVSRMIFTKLKS